MFNIITSKLCIGAKSSYVSYDKSKSPLFDHVIVTDKLSYFVIYGEIMDDNCILMFPSHRLIVFNIEFISYDNVTQ